MANLQPPLSHPFALVRRLDAARRWCAGTLADLDARLSSNPALVELARWPGLRRIVRRRAGALFDLCAGFVYAQVLAACVDLDLFTILRRGPRAPDDLARTLALPDEAALRLLQAAAALRLLRRRRDGRYALGPLGAAVAADPGIAAMVAHHRLFYADLADPVAFLRREGSGTTLERFWPYEAAAAHPAGSDAYTRLMAASQPMVARQVLAGFDFGRHRAVLDIGGGDGSFLRRVAERHPHLRLGLFDLPGVARAAEAAFAAAGVPATVTGGDIRCDSPPPGADCVTLIRVLHDHDDATALAILRAARGALVPEGTLVVAEPMAGIAGAAHIGEVYFPFYLMAMGRGRTRTPDELGALLQQAGFARAALRPTPLPMIASLIVATGNRDPTV